MSNTPHPDNAKVLEMIARIANVVEPGQLGRTKLQKIFWFADRLFYKQFGRPISGLTYVKGDYGPYSPGLTKVLKEATNEVVFQQDKIVGTRFQNTIWPSRSPDLSRFSADEIAIIDDVAREISTLSATSASEKSHDRIWEIAARGEEIPLEVTLASELVDLDPETLSAIEADIAGLSAEDLGEMDEKVPA